MFLQVSDCDVSLDPGDHCRAGLDSTWHSPGTEQEKQHRKRPVGKTAGFGYFWGGSQHRKQRTVLSHHITQFITTKSKNQLLLPRTKHFTISRYWPKEVLKTASKSSNFRASMPFCPPEVIKSTEQKSINLSQSTGNAWQTARTRSPGPGERCFTEDALAYDSI